MSRFDTTRWSVVLGAQGTGGGAPAALASRWCRTFWPPAFAYIHCRGPDGDDYARDAAASNLRRNAAAVSAHRLLQRLREVIDTELADTVASAEELQAEQQALYIVLRECG